MMNEQERNVILQQWYAAKQTLTEAKDLEMELRTRIVNESGMFDEAKEAGSETYDLGNGYKVKAVKKQNYKIANAEGEAFAVLHQLQEIAENPEQPQPELLEIARLLFSFDANIRKTQFDRLRGEEKKLVETILTISPATPSLEIIEPK